MTTTVPTAPLLPIIATLQTQVIAPLQALYNAAATSPPGTTINAPTTATLNDATGATWSFGGSSDGEYAVLRNGGTVGNGETLTIDVNGVIWDYYGGPNAGVGWYQWLSTNTWQFEGTTGPVT